MDLPKQGYVYVLQMEGHDYYKIGRTVNINRRVAEISPRMPGRLIVVFAHQVGDAPFTESSLHSAFSRHRMNGEWFKLNNLNLAEIKALLLATQALRLYHKALGTLKATSDQTSISLVGRWAKLLSRLTVRLLRRVRSFEELRNQRVYGQHDPVLSAEYVG